MDNNINFDEEPRVQQTYRQQLPAPRTALAVRILKRLSGGLIHDDRTAAFVLLGLSIIIIIVSVILFTKSGSDRIEPEKIPHTGTRR